MEIRQILQFSDIDGARRNPGAAENLKFVYWDNDAGFYRYGNAGAGTIDFNTKLLDGIVNKGDDAAAGKYIWKLDANKNPFWRKEDYLLTVARKTGTNTNWAEFTMNDSATKYLPLGALAWEDTVTFEFNLPGDQKILYDDNNSVGGSSAFKYDYNLNRVKGLRTAWFIDAQEAMARVGNYSFRFGAGSSSSMEDDYGTFHTSVGAYAGAYSRTGSTLNTNLGAWAGAAGETSSRNINLGPYTGRTYAGNDRLWISATNHADVTAAEADSLIWGKFDTRWVRINDSLEVTKEAKFGDSGLLDAEGVGGMFQMVDDGAGGIKPQWHDNTVWQDFVSGANYYLQEVVEDGSVDGLWHFIVKDSTGTTTISDFELQLPVLEADIPFATSPASPATGKTATSNYGYLQISSNAFTNNEGFTHKAGLSWDDSSDELFIPGGINLLTFASDSGFTNNTIWSNGSHGYIKIGGTSIQIDNETTIGEENAAINIGGGPIEWFKQRNTNGELEFRTFGITSNFIYNPYARLNYQLGTGGDGIFIGTTAELNTLASVGGTSLYYGKNNEQLQIKGLTNGTGVTFTDLGTSIQIDATGAGGGEVNTASNVGTGIQFFSDKNGVDFRFFTQDTTDARVSLTQATDPVADPVNIVDLVLTLQGENLASSSGYAEEGEIFVGVVQDYLGASGGTGTLPTYQFNTLVSDTITIDSTTVAGECRIEYGTAATATGTNLGLGVPIYVNATAPDFEFKTLNTVGLNSHLNITANGDGNTIDFAVDDLTYNFLGTSTGDLLAGSNGFEISYKGIISDGTTGITIADTDGDDIIFTQSIPIPYFGLNGSYFDYSTTYVDATKTVTFNLEYDADVRDGDYSSASTTGLFDLKLGDGLAWDNINKILYSTVAPSVGDTNDTLKSVTVYTNSSEHVLLFNVEDIYLQPSSFTGFTATIPRDSVDLATYTVGADTVGTVKINPSVISWTANPTQQLVLDEATGALSIDAELVTYDVQNELLDINNSPTINEKRRVARENIGSAYINGDLAQDFNADDLTVDGKLSANSNGDIHEIGDLRITGSEIYSDGVSGVTILPDEISGYGGVSIKVAGDTLRLNIAPGVALEVYDNGDISSAIKLMHLSSNGDLYIKGNIYAGGDWEAFDTDNLPTVGITP